LSTKRLDLSWAGKHWQERPRREEEEEEKVRRVYILAHPPPTFEIARLSD
jgi:hypothetical protein